MKPLTLIILFITFALFSMNQTGANPGQSKAELVMLKCKTDSLNVRNDASDQSHVQNDNAEDRREAMIRKYGKKKGPLIAEGRVWIGLSPEMARDSWGEPVSRKRSEGPWGLNETWHYPEGKYIFFENGRLSKWKE